MDKKEGKSLNMKELLLNMKKKMKMETKNKKKNCSVNKQ